MRFLGNPMWNEALSLEDVTRVCERKIGQLLESFYGEYPHLEKVWPSEVVEDAILFCGFGVVDEPLPHYQLALCDMGQRLVVVNSEMGRFVHKWTNLEVLRRVTLAHELGHVILHRGEICDRVYRSYVSDEYFVDARAVQQENEAELFGRLFLVPTPELLGQKETQQLQLACEERRVLRAGEMAAMIKRLATRFRVNPATVKGRFVDLGLLYPTGPGKIWSKDLSLRHERCRDD